MDMSLGELWELVMGREACDSWGRKESDTTERLNWTELNFTAEPPEKLEYIPFKENKQLIHTDGLRLSILLEFLEEIWIILLFFLLS